MAIVNRVLAAFLVVVGFLAWANLIATPVYHDGSPDYSVWQTTQLLHGGGCRHHSSQRVLDAAGSCARGRRVS